jgi:hypothetical protein
MHVYPTPPFTICRCICFQRQLLIIWIKKGRSFFGKVEGIKRNIILLDGIKSVLAKKGGLGIKNLRLLNICLMCQWWWKLEKEKGIWQEIVNNKYINGNSILNIGPRVGESQVWSDMLKVREYYMQGRHIITQSGDKTRFWENSWLLETPLAISEPYLFDICNDKKILVIDVIGKNAQLDFRRWFSDDDRKKWAEILENFQML